MRHCWETTHCGHTRTRAEKRWAAPALLVPPTRVVGNNPRKAQASFGATSSSWSPRKTCPLASGVTAPNFFLFVTTTGVMVS